ncbi:H-NS histone family protein [Paraburkholderia humisilvae]|uniref:DNA-binding protein Bv3F n=1 Tax=Paraburkholderia humisilvae TaxID=627669 RepID=A0A6J5E0M9_9BURK|nr:H-NS histone family protein [Paraburkholderia humisilvae]CAB3758712.1 DNA-binding protein Bv3F [Paraburkholderia humisilvae]
MKSEGYIMKELRSLLKELEEVKAQIELARTAESARAITTCKVLIETYGLTAHDLGLVRTQLIPSRRGRKPQTFRPKAPHASVPPKYRDPASGKTWSGRGRTPLWMRGDDRDAFLIRGAR